MELSVIQHHLLFSFSSVSISGVSYILEWNLLVKTFSLICKLFSCLKQAHQEIVVSIYGITSSRNAVNVYIIQKHIIAADDAYIPDNLNSVTRVGKVGWG